MQSPQLPSLEDIYDLSHADLTATIQQLTHRLQDSSLSPQQQQQYQEYIDSINTQIEERKTLQFFQEMCSKDNPYVQKVTDFNNQLLRLASEAIQAQQEEKPSTQQQPFRKKTLPSIPEQQARPVEENQVRKPADQHHRSTASTHPQEDDKMSRTTQQEGKALSVGSMVSESNYGSEKRSGIPNRKTKNTMKDFILSTLSKNKAEGCYVVKKGGPQQKAQPMHIVNDRGHLVNPNTLQPIQHKSHKASSVSKQAKGSASSSASHSTTASQKSITDQKAKMGDKDLEKKRQEAIEKVKGVKAEKKKEKPLNNKQLVEMIREEERKKEREEKKKAEAKARKAEARQEDTKPKEEKTEQVGNKEEEIREMIEAEEQIAVVQEAGLIKEEIEALEESKAHPFVDKQSQQGQERSTQKPQTKEESVIVIEQQKQQITESQTQFKPHNDHQTLEESRPSTAEQELSHPQDHPSTENAQSTQTKSESSPYHEELRQLREMKDSLNTPALSDAEEPSAHKVTRQSTGDTGVITDLSSSPAPDELIPEPPRSPKKCYNEDYWIHIREEAESQIRRFKEEKELEERSKNAIRATIQHSVSKELPSSSEQPPSTGPQSSSEEEPASRATTPSSNSETPLEEGPSQTAEFISKRKTELKRMVHDHKRRTLKKSVQPPPPPRPLHPLPEFNYLEVYPTFNHIFAVMYTKAEHQAIQDIPLVMKELTAMFATHVSHFKDKTLFQPGVFLPFDAANRLQLTDPRQLLMHAENTHVNLGSMVERLETFNGNLQGQFQDSRQRYYRVVKTREEVYDIISTGFMRRKGWKELPHGCSLRYSWNLFWSWSKPDVDLSRLLALQRINHFPFNKNLSRKDLLYRNLDSFRRLLKVPFPFLPTTYNLPKEFTQFSIAFHEEEIRNRERNFWIMKPIGKSRGRGIKVINNLAELNYTDNIVVQRYISNPLLIEGYKFDLRVYVLVTHFHPLEAFVYREGFARLSTEKYTTEPAHIKNSFMHLTNFSVNRNNHEAKESAFAGGSKISLKAFKDRVTRMGYSFPHIWQQVHEIIVKSLLGCSVSVPAFPTAFELFGYDVMVDTDGKCHLIEINASPSLERSYLLDEVVKQSLIDDILDIVDPPDFDKEALLDVMADRLSGRRKVTPEDDLVSLARVLRYQKVRKIGEMPEKMGLFQMAAPCPLSLDLERLIKHRSGANNPRNID